MPIRAICVLITAIGIGISSARADDKSVHILIGGPRRVDANLTLQDDNILIAVEMIPVRCFDIAKNKQVNRDKAEGFVSLALAQYFQQDAKGTARVTLRNKEVVKALLTDKRFHFVVRVPKDSIVLTHTPSNDDLLRKDEAGSNETSLTKASSLLTAKADHLATLSSLSQLLNTDLPDFPKQPSDDQSFFESIAKIEEDGVAAFSAIRSQARSDKLLLKVEIEEIVSRIDEVENEFLDRLGDHVRRWEKLTAKPS